MRAKPPANRTATSHKGEGRASAWGSCVPRKKSDGAHVNWQYSIRKSSTAGSIRAAFSGTNRGLCLAGGGTFFFYSANFVVTYFEWTHKIESKYNVWAKYEQWNHPRPVGARESSYRARSSPQELMGGGFRYRSTGDAARLPRDLVPTSDVPEGGYYSSVTLGAPARVWGKIPLSP